MESNPNEPLSIWASLFAILFLAGTAGSVSAWFWVLRQAPWITKWSGWQRDRPQALIGLVDLVGCFFCMVFVQVAMLASLQAFVERDRIVPDPSIEPGIMVRSLDRGLPSKDLTEQVEYIPGDPRPTKDFPTWFTPVFTIALLLGGALSAALVMFRTGASPDQIGLSVGRFSTDCQIGLIAFLLTTPVVLLVSQLAISVTEVEYKHPVMDAMADHPWAFPLLFFGAVVCAPIWEEYAFRGLLIGWFDSIRRSGGNLRTILLGRPAIADEGADSVPNPLLSSPLPSGRSFPIEVEGNPYHPPSPAPSAIPTTMAMEGGAGFGPSALDRLPPWWPALASGVLFGLAHYGYGISWVPLIVLGTVLGRLYQLRGSIVPCVVVHALFNGMSMLGLAVQLLSGKG